MTVKLKRWVSRGLRRDDGRRKIRKAKVISRGRDGFEDMDWSFVFYYYLVYKGHYRVLIPVTTFYPWGNVVPLRKDFQSCLGISVYTLFISVYLILSSLRTSCAASLFAFRSIDKNRMRYMFVLCS